MTTVLLFARARELAGAKSVVVEGTTVSDVLKVAGERFGDEFSKLLESCTIMVDDEVIRLDQQDTHSAGNEMAILPPVSGGSGDHNPAEDRGPAEVCGAHDAGSTRRLRVAVLTVSDRASAGTYEDRTGPAVESALAELGRPRAAVSPV
ncbi:MAG TPA: MoaD/ThiS family protein, partial [Microthrixaceae bacterium]|nr:MoaD/ThiS family protein [Microthrixaceae bacterium]